MAGEKPFLDLTNIQVSRLANEARCLHFRCGVEEIDHWVVNKAARDDSKNLKRVFYAHHEDESLIKGFYCLTIKAEPVAILETQEERDLYRTKEIPTVFLWYVAVDNKYQGQGLGEHLFYSALTRCHNICQNIGVYGVCLRALNDKCAKFYNSKGFRPIDGRQDRLMAISVWQLNALLGEGDLPTETDLAGLSS